MQNIRQIVAVAVIAGLGAGLLAALAHYYTTLPLIVEADVIFHGIPQQIVVGAGAGDVIRAAAEREPVSMFERFARTAFMDLARGLGFALVLTAAFMALNQAQTWRTGAYWGLAAFAALALAPNVVGLQPELPGMAQADPLARLIWYAVTVALTAAGIAILVFRRRSTWMALLAVAMIIAPHAYGAPQPPPYTHPLPRGLVWSYVASDVGTALLFWVALGAFTAILYQRRIRTESA